MSTVTERMKVAAAARTPKTNAIGLEKTEKGRDSTLCKGCGHDSISARIINSVWELGLPQHRVIKLSGIGCSSKTPAYFLGHSHGFNSLHGRMPSVATGAWTANQTLVGIGVSGDGDTVDWHWSVQNMLPVANCRLSTLWKTMASMA
ncbi:MAG: hypothetical protein R2867_23815 [Caldilineaceae bacterium]